MKRRVGKFTAIFAFVAGALAVSVAFLSGTLIPNAPSVEEFPVRGIDVSHHNGKIDWAAVAVRDFRFAFVKATEGSDWKDPDFEANWKGADAAGLARGAYHFFTTTSSGLDQADHFIEFVPKSLGMLPPVIDVEFERRNSKMSDEVFHREFRVFFERLRAHYGVTPIVYTTGEFHRNYFAHTPIDRLWARAVVWKPTDLA
ncbi:MAG: lysozyme, partial [Akkermansiaceae bacterium]|nr:lysozyme [Akkermansiaceae bacterium]